MICSGRFFRHARQPQVRTTTVVDGGTAEELKRKGRVMNIEGDTSPKKLRLKLNINNTGQLIFPPLCIPRRNATLVVRKGATLHLGRAAVPPGWVVSTQKATLKIKAVSHRRD